MRESSTWQRCFGITGMRERAALAGGRLQVLPAIPAGDPGAGQRGTLIRLILPARHRVKEDSRPAVETGDEMLGADEPHTSYGSAASVVPLQGGRD